MYTKRVSKDFEIRKLRWILWYVSLKWYILLGDEFNNIQNMRLEIYWIDPSHFFHTRAIIASSLGKDQTKIYLLTDIVMLLMVEKGIKGGKCHAIHQYAKASNKYMKDYYKNKESSYLKYQDVNNLCWKAMSRKFSVDGLSG